MSESATVASTMGMGVPVSLCFSLLTLLHSSIESLIFSSETSIGTFLMISLLPEVLSFGLWGDRFGESNAESGQGFNASAQSTSDFKWMQMPPPGKG